MLLNAKQLAEYLGVKPRTIYALMKSGSLPAGAKFGGSRRWDLQEVKQWFDGLQDKAKADNEAGNNK